MAEGSAVIGAGFAVISGFDRRSHAPFINQLVVGTNGGPATPSEDGWLTYNAPSGTGLIYRDSIEVDEHKYPIRYRSVRIECDTGGAGRFRAAPSAAVEYGPTQDPMIAAYSLDGYQTPARGARGGGAGSLGAAYIVTRKGDLVRTENMAQQAIEPGEWLRGEHGGGGGYGDPFTREPERALEDVAEGYVSREAATRLYGVTLSGAAEDDSLAVDQAGTEALRRRNTSRGLTVRCRRSPHIG
jgi:N-methylhydantoinase B